MLSLDSDSRLAKHFLPHQVAWIQAEKAIHEQRKQAVALAEKSVRIGWTYADAFKNVRKRLTQTLSPEAALLWSDDPRIWRPLR